MAQIRWRIIALLLWLAIFFNIERLDISGPDTINLSSSVYGIGIVAAIAVLTPAFQRQSVVLPIGLALGAYLATLVLGPDPVLGGAHTYLTFTGFFMLAVTVLLAFHLGQALTEFLVAVEEMTFSSKGGRLRTQAEAQELIHTEMVSSRRTQRPMSLVMLQADATAMNMMMHRLIQDIQRSMMQRYLLSSVARVLSRYLRRTDIIIEGQRSGRLVFLAPETNEEDAIAFGQRITRIANERLGVAAEFSIATFPQQALTFEELLNVAEQRLREHTTIRSSALDPDEEMTNLTEQRLQEQLPTPAPK